MFSVNNASYENVEQYYQSQKAVYFVNLTALCKSMSTKSHNIAKEMGKNVKDLQLR